MSGPSEQIAVIDIGSNSVRLFIFKISGSNVEQVSALKFFCGLGKDLGTTGKLNPEAVALTHKYLALFRDETLKYKIKSHIVIGTAALREAKDASAFIYEVAVRTGFQIKIISGEEEARLAALAILSTNRHASGVVADFGGGSLELARIGYGRIEDKVSLKLGAHYLKALPDRTETTAEALQALVAGHPDFRNPEILYLIGGSWRSLAKALIQDMNMSDRKLEGFSLDSGTLRDFCERLEHRDPDQVIEVYKMEPQRARLMDVSALMLNQVITILNPRSVEVSTAGIRDGVAYDYILKQR